MRRSVAQLFCLAGGLALLLLGAFGFISDSSFEGGDGVQGDTFLGFEVNGWHNVIHIASGLLLLWAAPRHRRARPVCFYFGTLYALVTLIGWIDGEDVLGVIPVNLADNILHTALTALALGAAVFSTAPGRTPLQPLQGSSRPLRA